MMLDVERLDETCIKKLANEEVLAIRVKGFLPRSLAIEIGDKISRPASKATSTRRASVVSAWRFMKRKISLC